MMRADRPTSIVQLSAEDRELAVRLFSLLIGSDASPVGSEPRCPVEMANAILEDRRRRAEVFGRAMFGEPAWELLLTLYVIDHNRRQPTIGQLARAAHVATSTAIRWLLYLEGHGLIARQEHPTDARIAMVAMTDKGKQLLATYFSGTMTPRL